MLKNNLDKIGFRANDSICELLLNNSYGVYPGTGFSTFFTTLYPRVPFHVHVSQQVIHSILSPLTPVWGKKDDSRCLIYNI
jgi:hypothetical protein